MCGWQTESWRICISRPQKRVNRVKFNIFGLADEIIRAADENIVNCNREIPVNPTGIIRYNMVIAYNCCSKPDA